ncbi:hypothetical protein H0H87_005094, partial [Tephrocybe sp. NHM501043]
TRATPTTLSWPSVHVNIRPLTPLPSVPTAAAAVPTPTAPLPAVNIHLYPTSDLLHLLASLLTQIATTNDSLATALTLGLTAPTPDPPIHTTLRHSP